MGSANIERCTEDDVDENHSKEMQMQRPHFYPCAECGRKFTFRALEIHKRSCLENDDCSCAVCKSSVRGKRWTKENNFKNDSEVAFVRKESNNYSLIEPNGKRVCSGQRYLETVQDNLQKTEYIQIVKMENTHLGKINLGKIDFKSLLQNPLLPSGGCSTDVKCEQSELQKEDICLEQDENVLSNVDSRSILTCPEASINALSTSEKLPNFKEETLEIASSSQVTDILEEHDGESCNRKLFCCVCNEHVYWESYGMHVIQHCNSVENEYLECPECRKSYSKPTLFLIHFYVHVSSHPIDCVECRCSYPTCIDATNFAISEHCYAETVPFHCYICLRRFGHCQTIVNHMRLHSKEMPYTCIECQRSFRQLGNLQRHMSTHRGDRPHKCPDCCRSFADPATLRNHVRVHTGETPYVCSICRRGFSQVGNLKRHMAVHLQKDNSTTNVPAVNITSDKKSLSDKPEYTNPQESETTEKSQIVGCVTNGNGITSNITNHIHAKITSNAAVCSGNTGTGKPKTIFNLKKSQKDIKKKNGNFRLYSCPSCGKAYTWRHDLAIHFRTHTGEKPYKCEICSKRFGQSGAVRIHKIRHHSDSFQGKSRWKV